MPVSALVIACVGPMCAYSATAEAFETVAQCERSAPIIAGISRASMTSTFWEPTDRRQRTSFRCVDSITGAVLLSFDSGDQLAEVPAAIPK